MSESRFAYALCQPGTERWLKAEVARLRPDLRPAFARPGLVTFKCTGAPFRADESPPTIFGRAWGCSAGPGAEVPALARSLDTRFVWIAARDAGVPGETPPARQAAFDASAAEAMAALPGFDADPTPGALVIDVITAPDEAPLVGWHRHSPRYPGPAGRLRYEVPDDLPSRAWRKVVEGLAWCGAPLEAGQTVLEIGAAPGGGARAFVERGLKVIAVDKNAMDPRVLALPGVTWIQRFVGDAGKLPPADWLACDADLAPDQVLGALRRVMADQPRLRGLLWTLKLVRPSIVDALPGLLDEVRKLGGRDVRAVQLAANRRDVFVYAALRA